jgi:hypothetical protein
MEVNLSGKHSYDFATITAAKILSIGSAIGLGLIKKCLI